MKIIPPYIVFIFFCNIANLGLSQTLVYDINGGTTGSSPTFLTQIPWYITLGNHDISSCLMLQSQINETYQLANMSDDYQELSGIWFLPSKFWTVKHFLSRNPDVTNRFVFIDTNLLLANVSMKKYLRK